MFISNKIVLPLIYWSESAFLDQSSEASDLIYIHVSDYQKIISRLRDDSPLFFKIFSKKNIQTSLHNATVRVGGYHNDDSKHIYAPQWIIDQLMFNDDLNTSDNLYPKANMMQLWNIPLATEIQIQNLNTQLLEKYEKDFSLDIRSVYEEALSQYGGVEFNRIIPLYLKIRDETFTVNFLISRIDPLPESGYVRFDGNVNLDIKEPPHIWNPQKESCPEQEDFPIKPEIKTGIELSKEELRQARLRYFAKI